MREHEPCRTAVLCVFAVFAVVLLASVAFGADDVAPSQPPIEFDLAAPSIQDLQQAGLSREAILRLLMQLHARGQLRDGVSVADIAGPLTPLEIVGLAEAEAGEPVWLDIVGVPEGGSAQFLPDPELTTKRIVDGSAMFRSKEPGRYVVKAVVLVTDWEARTHQLRILSHEITITGDGPGPDEPDPETDYRKAALSWLEQVPIAAREAIAPNPITGEKLTRQECVGETFIQIGAEAKKLGSIGAANVMLTTGMKAAFGPVARDWRSFADSADIALAELEAQGVSAAEYGDVLATIGRALR